MPLSFDTSKPWLDAILKDYQKAALRYLWSLGGEGAGSREIWVHVNKVLSPKTISRASVINYLNAMADEGFLNYTENTGKGGHHRVYTMAYTEDEFKRRVAEIVIKNLLREYPQETEKAIQQF